MKFHNVTGFLEAVAAKPLDTESTTFNQDLKIVRLIDYLTTGIDESFSDDATNAGGKARAKSRKGGRGSLSPHKDFCISCVNMIVTNKGLNSFSPLSPEDVLVPRIPAEYTGDTENVESEWAFIEGCQEFMSRMSDSATISLTTGGEDPRNISSVFGMQNRNKITKDSRFYKASLLFGYMIDENKLAYVDGSQSGVVGIAPGYLNLDAEMKYIDDSIESQRPLAVKLMKEIFAANPEDIVVTNENSGEVKNDIKDLLSKFKSAVPEDGNIFMSPNEIKEYLPLFEYFRLPADQRAKNDDFFSILTKGMTDLEEKGVHFGDNLQTAKNIQHTIMGGNYDLVVGYSQAGDTTHTETFKNKGEEIFVGYLTNYAGQSNNEVIPVYFTTQNPSTISKMNENKGKPLHVGNLKSTKTEVPFKKLNTEGFAKRTGGNEIIFQLPIEIYSKAGVETEQPVQPATETPVEQKPVQQTAPKAPKKAPEGAKPKKAAQKVETKPETVKEVAPVEKPAPKQAPKANEPETPAAILNRIGKEYKAGNIGRKSALEQIRDEIESKTGKKYDIPTIQKTFDKKFPSNDERSESEIRRDDEYNALFKGDAKDTRLAKSALPRIKSLADLGHKFTPEEISNLVNRGLNKADLDRTLGKSTVMEVRSSPVSFSLKALMENLSSRSIK